MPALVTLVGGDGAAGCGWLRTAGAGASSVRGTPLALIGGGAHQWPNPAPVWYMREPLHRDAQ